MQARHVIAHCSPASAGALSVETRPLEIEVTPSEFSAPAAARLSNDPTLLRVRDMLFENVQLQRGGEARLGVAWINNALTNRCGKGGEGLSLF